MYTAMLTAFWTGPGKLKGEVPVAHRRHVVSGIKKIVKSGVNSQGTSELSNGRVVKK